MFTSKTAVFPWWNGSHFPSRPYNPEYGTLYRSFTQQSKDRPKIFTWMESERFKWMAGWIKGQQLRWLYAKVWHSVSDSSKKKKKKKKSWLAESDWRVCQKFIKRILSESVKDSRSIPQSNSPLCFQTSSDERTVSMHATTSHAASDFKENEGTSDITVHWLVGWHIQVNYKDNFFFFPLFYRAHTCTGEWTVTSGGIKLPSGDPV